MNTNRKPNKKNNDKLMVEVFKTSIKDHRQANLVKNMLIEYLGYSNVAFDLGDRDKILRIEENEVNASEVLKAMEILRIDCEVLEDKME